MSTTKESISNALNKLLLTIPLNKISVKSICNEAHVNRQTFYYYYRDIIELLTLEMRKELYSEIEGGRSYKNWRYGFLQTLRYMKRNNAKIQNIYHSTYWDEVDVYFHKFNKKIINHVVLECVQSQHLTLLDEDKEFIINIYNMIFHGVFVEYIKSNMKEEPEAIVTNLNKIISGEVMKVVVSFSVEADKNK